MRRFALLAALALAGCPKPKDPPPATPAAPTAVEAGPRVLEEGEGPIEAAKGGSVALPCGAKFDAAPGAFAEDTRIRLVRAEGDRFALEASSRPRVRGRMTLSIPYDRAALSAGVSEENLVAAAVFDGGALTAIPCRLDQANQVVIVLDPEIACPGTMFRQSGPSRYRGLRATNIWYMAFEKFALGREGRPTVDLPDNCFHVVPLVSLSPGVAEFIATTLQTIHDRYTKEYAGKDGTPALARYTPARRMIVLIGKYDGVNGEYDAMTLKGLMKIDAGGAEASATREGAAGEEAATAKRKRDVLVGTLYHEMFHAVQDTYSMMYLGGNLAKWWYESTAEWGGLTGRGMTFRDMVQDELATYPYVLSLPIRRSGDSEYTQGLASYGEALLIEHVNSVKPGHLKETFRSWATCSDQLYARLVEDGKLRETYGDFARKALLAALPERPPWMDASLHVVDSETRVFEHESRTIGDPVPKITRYTDSAERKFGFNIDALTTRFFRVDAGKLKSGRTVDVRILRDGKSTADAWQVVVSKGAARAQRPATVRGLGADVQEVWLAVYNADPDYDHYFEVGLTVTSASAGSWTLSPTLENGIIYEIRLDPGPDSAAKPGPARWAALKLTVNGRSYTSYDRITEANGGTFPWPVPALKVGKNHFKAEISAFGKTGSLEDDYEPPISLQYSREKIAELKKDIAAKKGGPDAWIELGDRHRHIWEHTEARAAYEKARKLNPRLDDTVRQKLADVCYLEADLDGFIAALGSEDHAYARSRRGNMAQWAGWWKNDLGLVKRYWDMLKAERAREGSTVGEQNEFPAPGEEILK